MLKKIFAACILLTAYCRLDAQVLFSIGKDSVTVPEFMAAYNKNSKATTVQTPLNEYLDLYIISRLKVKEAKERGYDTLPQLVADLENLRQQIMPSYMTEGEGINKLLDEAYERSKKDIKIAHIFIKAGDKYSSDALRKTQQALKDLQKGDPFDVVAKKYSEDPNVKTTGGEIGYITVFTLPYELENLAYNTPVGKFSSAYQSMGGYHIFKNIAERKNPGKIRIAQILLAFPPSATDAEKAQIKKRADSIYRKLVAGADFSKLATQFSNDYISANAEGIVPEFGTGEYDPVFESKAFALTKDGQLAPPFKTEHGWHIIKRIGRKVETDEEIIRAELREKLEQNDRIIVAREEAKRAIAKKIPVTTVAFDAAQLYAYSDSVLNNKLPAANGISPGTVLLKVAGHDVDADSWIKFARTNRFKTNGSGLRPYSEIWSDFKIYTADEYYKKHLEDFNPAFRAQIDEFRNGNLFFEIMQKEVWGPSQSDSVALLNYYQRNESKYKWNSSADAVIFFASDMGVAKETIMQLSKESNWRKLLSNEQLAADSGRFEIKDIPNTDKKELKAGSITSPVKNANDESHSFAYIIRTYPAGERKNFIQAKGDVINDYQEELEAKWVNQLRAKYQVTINQPVLLDLLRKN